MSSSATPCFRALARITGSTTQSYLDAGSTATTSTSGNHRTYTEIASGGDAGGGDLTDR